MSQFRIEHDLLGDRQVPDEVYYGVHTLRAKENFHITGTPISTYPELINALALVKQAAAQANFKLGLLEQDKHDAIVAACQAVQAGKCHEHFVVDMIQGGAGTSTNMNANEVICNLALEHMGHKRGEYQYLHPNEDVNMAQSTNDVYPTALHLAAYRSLDPLFAAMERLRDAFLKKSEEFSSYMKIGRTQLQDAVPMTLGQEFNAFATMINEDIVRLKESRKLMCDVNLGGTAIGTGITAHPEYAELAVAALSDLSGVQLRVSADLIEATQDCGGFLHLSGVLKRAAVKLSKLSNDLRLLSSGPRAGMGEICLPAVQAGSSIMPGKVNPVIPEVVNQVAFEVIGADMTVTMAAEAGQLQLNAFEPVIIHSLLRSMALLSNACDTLTQFCVVGITANRECLESNIERSISLVTALNPFIGYKAATSVAAEAFQTGTNIRDVVLKRGLMDAETLNEVLRAELLIQPRDLRAADPA
ncbi:aspartate ammonia-lyase [Alcaligenes faecalis]|uniref:aspartate ammonia-lyase n=1 Tax=Alcaligenes faecalis TaxID=511 RepID=UPI000A2E6392|nr:aspartate ammonia-lyase [Alcaligenes faecalis]KAA1283755.1 aspartate ammonia-lyase [Alcaligenes faecalis]OSZ30892.1 aspartate ammonia-lyase [Alcaligenes faecalis]OSZ38494.1 aspartate ammonia-lyase [Alcaligenes faecalis]OSZ40285.1 aspartate ammonia-lyase [Alcaligenes faecalis]OSZ47820.1 aspartate ammonia-lyase [Alcaligenes faecalis]